MAEDIIDILVTNYNDNVTITADPSVTVINISNLTGLTGIIIPSGTIGRLPYYDTASTFADSNIYTTGTIVGINNSTPTLYSTNKGMVVRNPAGNVELLLQHDGNTANSIQGLSISTAKTDAAYIFQRENLPLKLGTNDTARVNILGDGRILMGSTLPTDDGVSALQINGYVSATRFSGSPASISTNVISFIPSQTSSYQGAWHMQAGSGSSNYGGGISLFGHSHATKAGYVVIGISNGSSGKFAVNNNGWAATGSDVFTVNGSDGSTYNTTGVYGTISDITLKENITDATNKLEKLLKTRIVNYNLIGSELNQIGVIAQELEEIFPSLVEINDSTGKKQVKYSVFIPIIIKAIQELNAKIVK